MYGLSDEEIEIVRPCTGSLTVIAYTDKRSGIVNDPNQLDDPQYIIRLIGKVIAVSLETVQIVGNLPEL